ncbi:vacuolar-processing enzyme beta-isozyme-like [Bidens hawaiensis]|uniref:vacuolar-processing enzyme beta-isozyme-like n=1 Tax=Bidens hawaiensis TaxID=980011 RepID=UPI00404ACA80
MFDDIANNPRNSMPGVIINSPKGSDVYAGVPKDYTGESVTAENFYAVLLGNSTAVKGGSGNVVASKPNDRIFVYYTDHGAPGLLGMTYTPVYANDFIQVLITKHASGTYDKMVIYVAASNSVSMFEGLLPDNLNIYALTSANANEGSYATYCPYDTENPPPELHNCLGDLFSVSWLEDSDSQDLRHETLEQQYSKVKERTLNKQHPSNGSHVMQYGTLSISNEIVSRYQGSAAGKYSTDQIQTFDSVGVIDQRDADLYSMWHKYKKSTKVTHEKEELLNEIKEITAYRAQIDSSVDMIKRNLLGSGHGQARDEGLALVDDWDCLKFMVRTFETYCGSLTQYGLKHTRTFANICNNGVTKKAMDEATKKSCSTFKMGQWDPATVD